MKKSELQEIAEKLLDAYGSDRHFEIISAEKMGDDWRLDIHEIKEPENDEGAKNDCEQ